MTVLADRMLDALPVIAIALPLLGALACTVVPSRARLVMTVAGMLTTVAALALAADVLERGARDYVIGGWPPPLGIALHVDGVAAALFALTSLIMLTCGIHARVRHSPDSFGANWLFTWAALGVVFLSDDVFNIYVALELLGIAAVGLVAAPGTHAALVAALRYLVAGLTGSALYLLGAALLYASTGTLSLSGLGAADTAPAWTALALMTAGLLLKSAVFPVHGWLPGAHGSAPAPASAVLSGVVVKAGIYLLWRLWTDALPAAASDTGAGLLGALGAGALVWGAIMALGATRLKLVVAYSTVSQVGYLIIAIPIVRAVGPEAVAGAMLVVASHALAKSACFLAVGAVIDRRGNDRLDALSGLVAQMPIATFALALGAVSLIGLPPSGGFAAKWLLIQSSLLAGAWWWVIALVGGSLLSAAVFARALGGGFERAVDAPAVPARSGALEWTALLLAGAALALGPFSAAVIELVGVGAR